MSRKAVLDEALRLVCADRELTHGSPDDVFMRISALWSVYIGADIKPEDVCHMMTLLKMARMEYGQVNGDDYVDSIGYQALAAELAGVNV